MREVSNDTMSGSITVRTGVVQMGETVIKANSDVKSLQRELLGRALENALDGEMEYHLGYRKNGRPGPGQKNRRNGRTFKRIRTSMGDLLLAIPRDRQGSFDPKIVPKYKRSIEGVDRRIVALYARGIPVEEIEQTLKTTYGGNVPPALVSHVANSIIGDISDWRSRPLQRCYVDIAIDAMFLEWYERGAVQKKVVYTMVGYNEGGDPEILSMYRSDLGSSNWRMGMVDDMKSRGVEHIGAVAADGITGLPDAIQAVVSLAQS